MASKLSRSEVEQLELKYGAIQQLSYKIGTIEKWYAVRKPTFDEYILFNKHVVNHSAPNQPPRYELDPEIALYFLSKVIIYPDDFDVNEIPPGYIMDSCIHSVNLSTFEHPDKLREVYINSLKNAHSIVGAIMQRILSMYGIQGYLLAKNMSEEELIDLITYSEVISGDLGVFAELTQLPDIPYIQRKKKRTIDLEKLLGIKYDNSQQSPIMTKEQRIKRRQAEMHYKSLGMSDDKIADLLNNRDKTRLYDEFNNNQDNKIDPHRKDEKHIMNMSRDEYVKNKKEGNLMSFEESQTSAFQESKNALAQQIEMDRENPGQLDGIPIKKFSGDLNRLLDKVKQHTRDL